MPATEQTRASVHRVFDVFGCFLYCFLIDERADLHVRIEAIPELELLGLGNERIEETLVDWTLHINAIGRNAGLAGVPEFGHHHAIDGLLQIRIFEDDRGRLPAEFE